jgi:hypothetical protein
MANEITLWQRQTYREGVLLALQQQRSLLREAVRDDGKLNGKRAFFDLLAATSMRKRTVRNQPTVLTDQIHNRRSATMDFYDVHMPVDPIDVHRIGSDPRSSYQQNGIMACNRTIDDVIIAAMTGSAWEDETGSTEVAFNAGGTALIASGGTGLTKDKIITAKKQFMANMVDPTEKLFWAYGSEQFEDLMNIDEVVNNDYNQKALQDGRVVYFCGFNWIPTERLAVGAIAGTRRNVAWVKSGMGFQLGQGMEVQINKRPDLSNIDQISISIDLGAARIEDGKVLAIDCVE